MIVMIGRTTNLLLKCDDVVDYDLDHHDIFDDHRDGDDHSHHCCHHHHKILITIRDDRHDKTHHQPIAQM